MKLKRLELHNYMIHRDLSAAFDGNLIALTGEMGHGKSTFVGAIQFALTGEHPPFHREDLVSWGESEGSVRLEFSQGGTECSVLRRLHSSEVVLKIGEETITGARNVERAMADRLGVDKEIIRQIGFVQQYEVQSILFDEPSKRERSFQKLLGIGDAGKIWSDLGKILQGYGRSENFDASIEALKKKTSMIEDELAGVVRGLEAAEKALGLLPSIKEQDVEIDRLARLKSRVDVTLLSRGDLAAKRAELEKVMAEVGQCQLQRSAVLNGLGCSMEELTKFVDDQRSEARRAHMELDNMKKLSGASDTDGKCPLCGHAVAPGEISAYVSAELKAMEDSVAKADETLLGTLEMYNKVTASLSRLDAQLASGNERSVRLASAVDALIAAEKAAAAELPGDIDPTDLSAASTRLGDELGKARNLRYQFDEFSRQLARLQGERKVKEEMLAQARADIEAKEAERASKLEAARRLEVLVRVRDWFHSSKGPRTMSIGALEALTGYVNEYLAEFHSEIEVMPSNQGLSFAYSYLDGRPVSDPPPDASKLSGGQKIELALAFRLAIYRYFGQRMGIMVLDEPEAHLSPAGKTYLAELLKTVSTLARNMDLQIIMPTHEPGILDYMDSVINFD